MGTTWNYNCLVVFLFLENLALKGFVRTRLIPVITYEMKPLVPLLDQVVDSINFLSHFLQQITGYRQQYG